MYRPALQVDASTASAVEPPKEMPNAARPKIACCLLQDTIETMVLLYSSTLENPNSAGKIHTGHGLGMCWSASHASAALAEQELCHSLICARSCRSEVHHGFDMPLHKRLCFDLGNLQMPNDLHNSQPLRAARRSGKPTGG